MIDPRTFHGFREHVSEHMYTVMKQPIVNLEDNEISHYEWLVRFQHEAGVQGVIRPAELSGAIKDLDLSMLARAVLTINKDPDGHGMAVNLSGASIDLPGFEHALMACLSALQGPPSKLMIELTETWDLENLHKAKDILQKLRERGHKICLDDVGAGAASIRYLRALPADYLKIDGEFVVSAMHDPRERAILEMLFTLRDTLGFKFIAEGVETDQILDFVRKMGFDAVQGYGVGKPTPETRLDS